MLVLGVVALVVLPLLALCEIVSDASTRSPPGAGTARRQPAPWDGSAHGRLRRAGRGRGRALHTARARGPSSDLPLARAVSRPAAQWPLGWRRLSMKRSASLRAGPAHLRGIASASLTLAAASPAA